jgi:hypothetical protein
VQNPQDYRIERADVESISGATIDLRTSIVELAIFEDIAQPFLTGTMIVVDTQHFVSMMNFTGTEKLTLQIASGEGDVLTEEKVFIITRINRAENANDYTITYSFELLEEHAFISRISKISQAFSGTPLGIIKTLISGLKDDLYLNETLISDNPTQGEIRLITPYITPLQAVEWIRDRTTSADGLPYFLYSSLKYNGIVVNSLAETLKNQAWNKTPFVYAQASTRANNNPMLENPYSITSFDVVNSDDTLNAMMNGAVSSQWNVLDIFNLRFNSPSSRNYSIDNTIPDNAVYNTDVKINNRPLKEYVAKQFYHLTASNLFDQGGSYHMDGSIDTLSTKIKSKGIRNAMLKNNVEVGFKGRVFLQSASGTVGSVVNVEVLTTDKTNPFDIKRSGEYIITSMRHTFANNSYNINASITKLVNTITDVQPSAWIK